MSQATFAIAAGANDGYLYKRASTYPPGGTASVATTGTELIVQRSLTIGTYAINVALLRWDTSTLPNDATVTDVKLKIRVEAENHQNSLHLYAEWYDPGTITAADWAEPVDRDAGSWALDAQVDPGTNTLTLSAPTNVSLTGWTGLRLGISRRTSDAAPTGHNGIRFKAYEDGNPDYYPQLIVTYTTPAPPTHELIGTAAGQASATGTLTVAAGSQTHELAGTVAGQATAVGTLTLQGGVALVGTAAGQATATGTLSVVAGKEPWINVWIDWDGDGDFGDANEHVTYDVQRVSVSRGRANVNDDFGVGQATIELANQSSLYSPFDTASALNGKLIPGKTIKIFAVIEGVSYPLFYGYTTDYEQSRGPGSRPSVIISATDAFDLLRFRKLRIALQESQRTDQLIATVLNAAAWDSTLEALDTGIVTVDEFWQHNATALEAIKQAANQELGGQLFVDASGNIAFKNRTARSSEPLHASFTGTRALSMGIRREDVVSRVEFTRAGLDVATAVTVLYTLTPSGRVLQPGSADPLNTIHGSYAVAGKSVVSPVSATDYTANTLADGTGIDKTASVILTSFTDYGGGFSATFENQDSSVVYLTLLQVRGQAVRRSNDERLIIVDAIGPILSDQVLSDSFDFYDDADDIEGYAQWQAGVFGQIRPRPVIELIPSNTQEYKDILGADLGKKIKVTNTTGLYPTTIDDYFFIEHISLDITPGVLVKARWTLFGQEQAGGAFFAIAPDGMTTADPTHHLYGRIATDGASSGKRIGW